VHLHRAEVGDDTVVVAVEAVAEPYEAVALAADELYTSHS